MSGAVHKAVISVDEKGTEAAAATAIVMMQCCMRPPLPPVEFHVDQPCCFFIFSRQNPLFSGRLADP